MLQFAVWIYVLPRLIAFRIATHFLGRRSLSGASEAIARIPGLRGTYMRQAFYGSVLESCGMDVAIGWGTVFSMTEASLGDKVYIGRCCSVGFGRIGSEAMLGDNVYVLSGGREHDREGDRVMHSQGQTYTRVSIGCGAWIGAGAIIMADVGEQAIVGAGAVVNRPIPDGAIAVGVPAKVVRWREGWNENGRILPLSNGIQA